VADDVIDDVCRRVVNATRFADFRLLFNLRLMSRRERDDLAEELLVNLPENVGGNETEDVRTFGIIKMLQDAFE
jgi:hypothetical protein